LSSDTMTTFPALRTISLQQQLHDAIDAELGARAQRHQARIAQLRSVQRAMREAGRTPLSPLVMLAQGDSWFDYPLDGNNLGLANTDIIAQLQGMGTINPVILSLAHYGEASTDEMALQKQQRMIQMLLDPSNWLDQGKPDAILFSAGGNDVAGDQFCIYLDYASSSPTGLDAARFQEVLDAVEASYQDLFKFRDRYASGVPIFAHCYDFPLPTGIHPACVGPWLKPSLDFTGWNFVQGTAICHQALQDFRTMLASLAAEPANLFFLVDTQGVLAASDWANELHPYAGGFAELAGKFVDALHVQFPTRI
jgi:hypothetical protein